MVSNEVFVGANAQVGLAPEVDMYFNSMARTNDTVLTLLAAQSSVMLLIPDLYVGCTLKVTADTATVATYYTITANTTTTITVDSTLTAGTRLDATILAFGAPCLGPKNSAAGTILSDNWIGLVNTFTPPSVEVEMKQLNLAAAGGRNFDFQYKGAETISGGSLDISMNNGSWLYYALGKITTISATGTATTDMTTSNGLNIPVHNVAEARVLRAIGGNLYPEVREGNVNDGISQYHVMNVDNVLTYTFGEADDDVDYIMHESQMSSYRWRLS